MIGVRENKMPEVYKDFAEKLVQLFYRNLNNGILELLKDKTITTKTTIDELLKIIEDKKSKCGKISLKTNGVK